MRHRILSIISSIMLRKLRLRQKNGFLLKKKKKKRVAGYDEYLKHAFYKRSFSIRVSLFHTSVICTIKK